ncbi:MAG: hypothetical protein LBT79_02345 [Elusimicrobiota bacterium]|jgi:probable addiction module antidote protein|nr:hypothetical protein [Elusimicrobiota bacterium]
MKKEQINSTNWEISKIDYDTNFAKILSKDDKHLQSYKKKVIKEYNESKNLTAFLASLKIIAMAQKNIPELAKKVNMKRPNVYRILSRESNPAFNSITTIAHNLGIDFVACSAK